MYTYAFVIFIYTYTNCICMSFSKNAQNRNVKPREEVVTKLISDIFPHPLDVHT